MKFGSTKLEDAMGGILAHSLTLPSGKRLRKGAKIDEIAIATLNEEVVCEIIVAIPEEGDIPEDIAATLIANQFEADGIRIEEASTGRVNLYAAINGVFRVSPDAINAINSIDPAITIATLSDYASINSDRLIATIKIIPYAVTSKSVEAVLALDLEGVMEIVKYRVKRIGLISTQLPSLKASVMDKTKKVLEQRIALSGSNVVDELRVGHNADEIFDAINELKSQCDMLIIFGASAISDLADCIPQAIEKSGGEIIRFGMPVDPGNLMLLAKLDDLPIIGAPGCARSIAENGFDWILQRLLAGIAVSSEEIASMGVGGLLMETGARPYPRETKPVHENVISGVVLAAGQSRRMGAENKMTVKVNGKPMVRHVVEAASQSKLESLTVVTGHKAQEVLTVVDGLKLLCVHNPDYETGLSSSLATGTASLDGKTTHALIMLGDMPFIKADMIDAMIAKASENSGCIIVATHKGKRGNPVLWPRKYFAELQTIEGDVGAKHILAANQDNVVEVELGEAASIDLDTPAALKAIT